jgi:hypothetical protein
MTDIEKRNMLKALLGIKDVEQDGLLDVYLQLAAQIVVETRYPYGNQPIDEFGNPVFPSEYDLVQVQMAQELYMREGSNGAVRTVENGITTEYATDGISGQLLRRITPLTRTI